MLPCMVFGIQHRQDDDAGSSCSSVTALVTNEPPTAAIGPSGQSSYGGVSPYIARAGEPVTVEARSTDPGSDDLTLTWDWNDGPATEVLSLVNPPGLDPPKRPTVQPRDETLSRSHSYASACLYDLEFRLLQPRSRQQTGGQRTAYPA